MSKAIILTGKKFGRWTVISVAPSRHNSPQLFWYCVCDCGNESVVVSSQLRSGHSKSCGCLKKEMAGNQSRKHGLRGHAIYYTWYNMIRRCYDVKDQDFKDYGGRGISVCEFLRASPANLLGLLGEKPNPEYSIDRTNNKGNYSCGNCAQCVTNGWEFNLRWATAEQQVRNRRIALLVTRNGITKSPLEWSKELGMKYGTFHMRLLRGTDPFLPLKIVK